MTVNWKMYNGFNNDGKFWTDSNSLQMMERERDYKPGYNYNDKHQANITSNYYPITSAIAMRNHNGSSL